MIDHVLIVWTDGEPEVLVDQPEAGVVDVGEEQRAGADGQYHQRHLTRAACPSTKPRISDDAVMVATVAEPVARRISTAIIQASRMHREVRALRPARQQGADPAVDQNLLEAATCRDDQDDAGDRRQTRLDASW